MYVNEFDMGEVSVYEFEPIPFGFASLDSGASDNAFTVKRFPYGDLDDGVDISSLANFSDSDKSIVMLNDIWKPLETAVPGKYVVRIQVHNNANTIKRECNAVFTVLA